MEEFRSAYSLTQLHFVDRVATKIKEREIPLMSSFLLFAIAFYFRSQVREWKDKTKGRQRQDPLIPSGRCARSSKKGVERTKASVASLANREWVPWLPYGGFKLDLPSALKKRGEEANTKTKPEREEKIELPLTLSHSLGRLEAPRSKLSRDKKDEAVSLSFLGSERVWTLATSLQIKDRSIN